MMKISKLVLTLLAAGMGTGLVSAAHAADASVEQQLKAMKQEIQELRDQLAAQGNESVVLGDIPNSIRMPKNETSLRIYGYAEANLIKDFKATAPGDSYTNLPEQPLGSGNPEGKTLMTAQTSRLGFETSTPTAVGPIHTQVEGDFYAYCGSECNRNRFRVRLAYGEYAGWMAGQNWSTFMDLDNGPETADFNGPIGMPFSRPVQLRYTYNTPTGGSYRVALENPTDGAQRPNLVLFAQHNYDWGNANVRFISHEQRSGTIAKDGSGFGVGGQYKLTDSLTLLGQYAEVENDGDVTVMMGGNYTDTSTGSMLMDKTRGGVFGLTNVFSEKLRVTLAYGFVASSMDTLDNLPYVNAIGAGSGNKRLDQWHVNFVYTPIKGIDLFAELIGGKRTTFDGQSGDMSRMHLMARYSFN